jgi:hypothetical protein
VISLKALSNMGILVAKYNLDPISEVEVVLKPSTSYNHTDYLLLRGGENGNYY